MEIDRYLRVPFADVGADWGGCNCWGLVVLAYREERGIELPSFADIPARSLRRATAELAARAEKWRKVLQPEPFDVAVMRGVSIAAGRSFGLNSHVGLVVAGGNLLHTEEGVGPAHLPLADSLVARRLVEFRRWAGDC